MPKKNVNLSNGDEKYKKEGAFLHKKAREGL